MGFGSYGFCRTDKVCFASIYEQSDWSRKQYREKRFALCTWIDHQCRKNQVRENSARDKTLFLLLTFYLLPVPLRVLLSSRLVQLRARILTEITLSCNSEPVLDLLCTPIMQLATAVTKAESFHQFRRIIALPSDRHSKSQETIPGSINGDSRQFNRQ